MEVDDQRSRLIIDLVRELIRTRNEPWDEGAIGAAWLKQEIESIADTFGLQRGHDEAYQSVDTVYTYLTERSEGYKSQMIMGLRRRRS